jgi:anaerobic selenocysteine-containing dehydrogenase
MGTVPTYCRICEACCGLMATVVDGRVVSITGDAEHPTSKGYLCPKGARIAAVTYDPERVTRPLRRAGAPGQFEPVSWDEALGDIVERCRRLVDTLGPQSLAMYSGNPLGFSMSHSLWAKRFMDSLGAKKLFSAAAQDATSRLAASWFLYGSAPMTPIPDVYATDLLLIVGANPLVTHGSLISVGRIRETLQGIVDRGGRVVVIDPARTKTASAFEHLPIVPGTDVWLLGAMLNVIIANDLHDTVALARQADGFDELRAAIAPLTVQEAETRTGIAAAVIEQLARDFAASPAAVAYGRIGTCRGQFSTLTNHLLDGLSIVTGNLDRRGGLVFGKGLLDIATVHARANRSGYGSQRTRIGDLPDVTGRLPWVLPQEILTSGPEQIRGLFCSAGNPVVSAPDGASMETALESLELFVSLDYYVTESNRYAHYILPGTTFLERPDDFLYFGGNMPRPWAQSTPAVVSPVGDCREEWTVFEELIERYTGRPSGEHPDDVIDDMVRHSPRGQRDGWTLAKLRERPHGVLLDGEVEVGDLADTLSVTFHGRANKVQLGAPEVLAEVPRLLAHDPADGDFPLLLIGRRDLRSINSWMHNVRRAASGPSPAALHIHPIDAATYGVTDGPVQLSTRLGSLVVRAEMTEDIIAGTVSYPHGWGHDGGWTTANGQGGANINRYLPNDVDAKEKLSGVSFMDGVPVRVDPLDP